jgi:hypothetical protein
MDTTPETSNNRISIREWRYVWTVIIGILLITSLPYLYGYLSSPPDRQFMGIMLDVPDHGQYLAWWRAFQDSLLISNKLTPEPNGRIFFNLQWWTLAQVSVLTGLGYAPVYQAFRWLAGGSFLWATYRLIAQITQDSERRRTAFLLVALSSGLGWILVILKYTLTRGELLYPLDVYIAEGNSFLCILGYPHFAFAATFIFLVFEFIWRGWTEKRTKHMITAGVLGLLLGWMHAYDLLLIYTVMGTFALLVSFKQRRFAWRLFWGGIIVFLLSCSGAIYSVILTTVDPLWSEVLAQFSNAGVYTPSPPHLVILFGFPLVAALAVWVGLARRGRWSEENLFIMGWFLVGGLLLYIPTDFQIHMLNSWQFPMLFLVAIGLHEYVLPVLARQIGKGPDSVMRWARLLLLVAVIPTNVYLWAWRFVDLGRHDYPYYLHRDDVAALEWMSENTTADEVVLCSITVGQYVPAVSGNTAYLAHWAQTVDYYTKLESVARFFDVAVSDEERVETMRTFGVDYILHGPSERELGEYDLASSSLFDEVFTSEEVQVYRVRPE